MKVLFCFVFSFFLKKPEDQLLVTSIVVKHCRYQSLYRTVQSGQILTNNVSFYPLLSSESFLLGVPRQPA